MCLRENLSSDTTPWKLKENNTSPICRCPAVKPPPQSPWRGAGTSLVKPESRGPADIFSCQQAVPGRIQHCPDIGDIRQMDVQGEACQAGWEV